MTFAPRLAFVANGGAGRVGCLNAGRLGSYPRFTRPNVTMTRAGGWD